jgi:hypothetical protein
VSSLRTFLVCISLTGIAVSMMGLCLPAYAQRVTSVGGSVDVATGLDNYPITTVAGESSNSDTFYSISPSVTLASKTARSSMNLGYAFSWNRFNSEPPRDTTTHSVTFGVTRQLSPRWNMSVSDSYSLSNDLHTFYAISGYGIEEGSLVFFFHPVTTNASVGYNSLNASFDHKFSPRSSLSFGAGHSIGLYGDSESSLAGLSDNQTFSANASYSRQINDRTSWNVGYSGSYFTFDKFNSAIATTVTVGLSSTVAKNTTLSISAGPSRVNNLHFSSSDTNLSASVSATRRIQRNNFHFSISTGNAMSSGVGSVSSSRTAAAGFSRPIGHRVNVFTDFSAFDGTGLVGNPFNTRGMSASGNVGFNLVKNLSVQGGVQFTKYTKPSPYAYTQKRLFVSLRYSHPNLLRWH